MRQRLSLAVLRSAAVFGPRGARPRQSVRDAAYLAGGNVALQLPFWLAGHFYSFQRPVFNYDLAIALLGFCLSKWIGWLLLCLALFIDAIRIASLNFHFQDLSDFIEAAEFVKYLNISGFASSASAVALGFVLLYAGFIIRWLRGWKRSLWVGQLLILLALGTLDTLNGSMQVFGGGLDRLRSPVNVAGSPIWNIYSMRMDGGSVEPALTLMPSVVNKTLQEWHASHPYQGLLLILVESMGEPQSEAVRAWLARQLQTEILALRWHLRQGEESYRGATTHGELRVLCGLDGSYKRIDGDVAPTCLPKRLNLDGFESVGYHGFQLAMFDRQRWWKTLGLTAFQFDYKNAASQVKDCHNVFHGVCDVEVLREAVNHVQTDRRFSYVITLDTHLPLPSAAAAIPDDVRALCLRERTPMSACELVNQLGVTLRSLAHLLVAGRNTPFVAVVGDHSPPFLERESRAAFLPDKVPFYILEPR